MLGVDGTGLFNANWMQPGSGVIYVLPYMAAAVIPRKGDTFVRLWRALGLRTYRMDVTSRNDTVVTSPLKWCATCVYNSSLHVPRGAVNRALVPGSALGGAPCAASLPNAFSCVLSQDSRLSPSRTARLARTVAAEIATSTSVGPNATVATPPVANKQHKTNRSSAARLRGGKRRASGK